MQIKVNDLTHSFMMSDANDFEALKGVNATFKEGEFITIIGKTGSGKTTFIEHLNALLKPTTGKVVIGEKIITNSKKKIKDIKKIRSKVGIVFQFAEYQLFEDKIWKDIAFGPINMGVNRDVAKVKAEKYLKLVGLPKDYLERSPFQLSGGQKRRVALAGILAMEPDYLIFDEPTAGLDPQGEIEMYKIFNRLHKSGKTIIIVTHNLDHALEHSNRTIIFDDGLIVEDGETIKLLYDQKKLEHHQLEVPKLVSLVNELEKKGKTIGQVRSINELAKKLGG